MKGKVHIKQDISNFLTLLKIGLIQTCLLSNTDDKVIISIHIVFFIVLF